MILKKTTFFAAIGCALLFGTPAFSSSESAATKRQVQLYPEAYNSISKRFKRGDSLKDYHEILGIITDALEAQGWEVNDSPNKEDADIHIIFAEIPLIYSESPRNGLPEIHPLLPLNVNANGATVRHLTSPWMNATLYMKQGEIAGGIIVVPIAPFARIRELYLASQDNWDAILNAPTNSLDDTSISSVTYTELYNTYYGAFLGRNARSDYRPDTKNVHTLFADKGRDALMLGTLFSISPQSTVSSFSIHVDKLRDDCLHEANPFYRAIYELLFHNMFAEAPSDVITRNSTYNFVPSTSELENIGESTIEYNCFIKKR